MRIARQAMGKTCSGFGRQRVSGALEYESNLILARLTYRAASVSRVVRVSKAEFHHDRLSEAREPHMAEIN